MNSQIESPISSAISERIIPQMQSVVETLLNRQLESVQPLTRRTQTANDDERNVDDNNLQNGDSRSRPNLMEPESLHDAIKCYSSVLGAGKYLHLVIASEYFRLLIQLFAANYLLMITCCDIRLLSVIENLFYHSKIS